MWCTKFSQSEQAQGQVMPAPKNPPHNTCHPSSRKRSMTQLTTTHTRSRVAPPSTIHLASQGIVIPNVHIFSSASFPLVIYSPMVHISFSTSTAPHSILLWLFNLPLFRLKDVKNLMDMKIVEIRDKVYRHPLHPHCFIWISSSKTSLTCVVPAFSRVVFKCILLIKVNYEWRPRVCRLRETHIPSTKSILTHPTRIHD